MKVCLVSLPLLFLNLGCAVSHSVGVNGYSSTGQALEIPEGVSICVVTDSNAPNPLLEREIGNKIRTLLENRGYSAGTSQPGYYLIFKYGIDSGRPVMDSFPIRHPTDYWGHSGIHTPGYVTYVPHWQLVYTRWLVLTLMAGDTYRTLRTADPVWIGEATSVGSSPDLREIVDYMLIAALEHFGEDTGKRVTEAIPKGDERVELLRERQVGSVSPNAAFH